MAAVAPQSQRLGITKLANILRDKYVPLNLEYIFIINILMAIRVTTLCHRRPTATLLSHSRRHTTLRNHTKKQVTSLNLEKHCYLYYYDH